ncbi:unnamed protein product [Urochloa decumbens]|uniref:Uncharacterized protein n=1 Tax=Urochloa decumbens TaxID=240449 RepID=A0ABC9FP14_9POAL
MAGTGGADSRRAAARVVVFPLPFQGHISPMLQLAGALHARGLAVTVLHTEFNAPDPARHLEFDFVAVPDAIPETVAANGIAKILALNAAMEASGHVHGALASLMASASAEREGEPRRLACLVIDSTLTATQKATAGLGLPTLVLHTGSAACFRLFRSYDMLHDKGYLPSTESNLDMPIEELPPLLVRDLFDPSKLPNKEIGQMILNLATETTTNSSGPLHKLIASTNGGDTSLLDQDHSCIEWLDSQAPGSVLFVSFGSVVHVTQDEFTEIAWGLANSGKPFLWVVRRGLVLGVEKQQLPDGFESAMEGRGKVIKWAPQQEVLAHPAVVGFWTHSGWNSTLESIYEGVPMLSRPVFGDQLATGRYVADTWKIDVLLDGVLERGEIEKAITRVMDENTGVEIRGRAKELKEKVRMCLESSGSSQQAVDKLVDHILSL